MEYKEPFRLPVDDYKREIDVIEGYMEQLTLYIWHQTDHKYSQEFIRKQIDEMFAEGGELAHSYPSCKM